MGIPCDDNCICVPICIGKDYQTMMFECELLRGYLISFENTIAKSHSASVIVKCMGVIYTAYKQYDGHVFWEAHRHHDEIWRLSMGEINEDSV